MMEGILLEEALKLILDRVHIITDTVNTEVSEAGGCILAEDVYSPLDNPPFPRSPVDGYAVRAVDIKEADQEHPAELKVAGCIYAGDNGQSCSLKPGEAYRIMTGAPFPAGADTAVKQEDTDFGEDRVKIYKSQKSYDNYCFQGEDYKKGRLLLKQGTRLTFAEQGILSGIGYTEISVFRKPAVRVFTTGDELCPPGRPLKPGKIYDSNGMMVSSRLRELGILPRSVLHQPDSEEELAEALQEAAKDADVILTTGGVSVGKKDILHGALKKLGAEKVFWRIRLQPGMPTIFSVYHDTCILSLSGNPFGAMANLELLFRPMLAKMTGDETCLMEKRQGIMEGDFQKKSRVRRFVRAVYKDGNVSFPQGIYSSGAIGTLRGCNCLLDIPAGTEGIKGGEKVTVWML
ncbi:MAG TPA: molybdopterin molybdotransferase MoeA [Candidatus Blautia intestinipullorum]|nr:molybdopterin molybdotransferase MoeA [Candidatus Blautia intestinipullorum]